MNLKLNKVFLKKNIHINKPSFFIVGTYLLLNSKQSILDQF